MKNLKQYLNGDISKIERWFVIYTYSIRFIQKPSSKTMFSITFSQKNKRFYVLFVFYRHQGSIHLPFLSLGNKNSLGKFNINQQTYSELYSIKNKISSNYLIYYNKIIQINSIYKLFLILNNPLILFQKGTIYEKL